MRSGSGVDDDLGAFVVDDGERERGLIRGESGDRQADEAREHEHAEAESKTRPPGRASGGRIDRSGRDPRCVPLSLEGLVHDPHPGDRTSNAIALVTVAGLCRFLTGLRGTRVSLFDWWAAV